MLGRWLNAYHVGDCLDIMRQMPDSSIKAVITSPPYNIKNSTGNGLKNTSSGKWPSARLTKGYSNHQDCLPYDEYVAWQRECLKEMMRLLRNDGAIFYNHSWRVQKGLIQDRSEIVKGFPVRQIIVWHRSGGINFNSGYFLPNYEVIYLIANPQFALAPKANRLGSVWRIHQERNNQHPAPFPVELAKRCVMAVGPGVILDPFMGSGTTAIAAESYGNDWIGIDLSDEYHALAEKRLANFRYSQPLKIFRYSEATTHQMSFG